MAGRSRFAVLHAHGRNPLPKGARTRRARDAFAVRDCGGTRQKGHFAVCFEFAVSFFI